MACHADDYSMTSTSFSSRPLSEGMGIRASHFKSETPMDEGASRRMAKHVSEIRDIQDITGEFALESPFKGQNFRTRIKGVVTSVKEVKIKGRWTKAATVQMLHEDIRDVYAAPAVTIIMPGRGGGTPPYLGTVLEFSGQILEVQDFGDDKDAGASTTTAVKVKNYRITQQGTRHIEDAFETILSRGVKALEYRYTSFKEEVLAVQKHLGLENDPEGYLVAQRAVYEYYESAFAYLADDSYALTGSNVFADIVFGDEKIKEQYPTTEHGAIILDGQSYKNEMLLGVTLGASYRSAAKKVGGRGYPSQDVGAVLKPGVLVWGSIVKRANGTQIEVHKDLARSIEFEDQEPIVAPKVELNADPDRDLVVWTKPLFNFDPKKENPELVNDPERDVSDNIADEMHLAVAEEIANSDSIPGVMVLTETQVNNGAENIPCLEADITYQSLLDPIKEKTGVEYKVMSHIESWETAGGQPHGSIHVSIAYDPNVMTPVPNGVTVLGKDSELFKGTRKPYVALFRHNKTGEIIAIAGVHARSLRTSNSHLHKSAPGRDKREPMRDANAEYVSRYIKSLGDKGITCYVTGDFNDVRGGSSLNVFDKHLSVTKPMNANARSYNYRGKADDLEQGVVNKQDADRIETIVAGSIPEKGVQHGNFRRRDSDHGSLWAKIKLLENPNLLDDDEVLSAIKAAEKEAVTWGEALRESYTSDFRLLGSLGTIMSPQEWVPIAKQAVTQNPDAIRIIAGWCRRGDIIPLMTELITFKGAHDHTPEMLELQENIEAAIEVESNVYQRDYLKSCWKEATRERIRVGRLRGEQKARARHGKKKNQKRRRKRQR